MKRELLLVSALVVLKVIVSCTGKAPAELAERVQIAVNIPGVIKFDIVKDDWSTTET